MKTQTRNLKLWLIAILLIAESALATRARAQSSIGATQGLGSGATSSTGTVTTGTGLAGNGSAGSPVMLSTPVAVGNGGTGTAGTLTGLVRGGSPMTAAELSGDVTTSGSNAATVTSTHLTAGLPVAQGGTGATSAGATAAHNIGAAVEGPNSDITSLSGLTTPLSVAQGGSGAAASGAVAYSNIAGGVAANVNLTGTDTICLGTGAGCASSANQKLTLTANETLTIKEGTISNTPSSTNLYQVQFEICQNATGSFTLAFAAGTGVSAIDWSGGSQPGYTLTAGNGDTYSCSYNGTNLYCREIMSNTPCE